MALSRTAQQPAELHAAFTRNTSQDAFGYAAFDVNDYVDGTPIPQPASPAPRADSAPVTTPRRMPRMARHPWAARPAARKTAVNIGIGDEVLFDGSAGYVDDADMFDGVLKAYVIGRKGAWAAWVDVNKLHRISSAAVLH